MSSIQVAVRIRPSKRLPAQDESNYEKKLDAALKEQYVSGDYSLCVDMFEGEKGETVRIKESESSEVADEYVFTHAFWSHDQDNAMWADQISVYRKIGRPLIDKVFDGYNACLFAYGQTGSGKTFTMMGKDPRDAKELGWSTEEVERDMGIVPRIFRDLAAEFDNEAAQFKVSMSMLEIYNNKLFDLLSDVPHAKQELHVTFNESNGRAIFTNKAVTDRQSLQYLCSYPVLSLDGFETLYAVGNTRRAVAATSMNASSSRSHLIVILNVWRRERGRQATEGQMFLVDLAGSERLSKTKATGQQEEEGKFINTSLLALGTMINEISKGRAFKNYRNNLLTLCLKNAIGGNCLTVVFGAVGPSSFNFQETKNTLRFCERASKIKCNAVKDEKSMALGRGALAELKKDNEALLKQKEALEHQLEALKNSAAQSDELEALRAALAAKEAEVVVSSSKVADASLADLSDEELAAKMKAEADAYLAQVMASLESSGLASADNIALLVNLAQDDDQDGIIRYAVPPGRKTALGSGPEADVKIQAYRVRRLHCHIENVNNTEAYLLPQTGAETRVNGNLVETRTRLENRDVICLGTDLLFYYDSRVAAPRPTWAKAMADVAKGRGLQVVDDKAAAEQKLELANRDQQIEELRKRITEIKEAEELAKLQEQQRKLEEEQREINDKMVQEQSLSEVIVLCAKVNEMASDLHLEPSFKLEANLAQIVTARGRRTEVGADLASPALQQPIFLPRSDVDHLLAMLQEMLFQAENNDGVVADCKFDLPSQRLGAAMLSCRALFFLCALGYDDDLEHLDPTPFIPLVQATEKTALRGSVRGAEAYVGIEIKAPVSMDEENAFLSDDISEVLQAWHALRDKHATIKFSIAIEKCRGLPSFAAANVYCEWDLYDKSGHTEISNEKTTQPSFNYKTTVQIPVTNDLIEYLSSGSFVVEIMFNPEPLLLHAGAGAGAPAPMSPQLHTTSSHSLNIANASEAELRAQVVALATELEQARSRLAGVQTKYDENIVQATQFPSVTRVLKSALSKLRKTSGIEKPPELTRTLTRSYSRKMDTLKQTTEKLEEENDRLSGELKKERAERERIAQELQFETTARKAKEEQVSRLEADVADLKKRLKKAESQASSAGKKKCSLM